MKRVGNLWERCIGFYSLAKAAERARCGKRFRNDVLEFDFHLERNLWQIHEELATKTYRPREYHSFQIYEPKQRTISAAPYRDRVVHHALTRTLDHVFEPTFTDDSFACRKMKGSHAAVGRAQVYARRYKYVLKADVRKFFPSIDHEILLKLISRKIKDPDLMWLTKLIVDGSNEQEPVIAWFPGDDLFTPFERRRGLPIGNQTSQFFSNVYLNPLDHFVREDLRARGYVRYVDDFLVFGDDKKQLIQWREDIAEFLFKLRLRLHPHKCEISPTACGIRFLGFRVFPWRRMIAKESVRRFRRRIRRMQKQYACGDLSSDDIRRRLMSWMGHASQGSSPIWRSQFFGTIVFRKGDGR